jgi:hypothetical protein
MSYDFSHSTPSSTDLGPLTAAMIFGKPLLSHMANRFRSCAISNDGPLFRVRHSEEQVGRVHNLTAHAIRFVIDINCSADNMAADKTVGSVAKPQSAPKRCVASSGVSKSSMLPVTEYTRFAVGRITPAKRADICQGLYPYHIPFLL